VDAGDDAGGMERNAGGEAEGDAGRTGIPGIADGAATAARGGRAPEIDGGATTCMVEPLAIASFTRSISIPDSNGFTNCPSTPL
jgi:hypothetical protein